MSKLPTFEFASAVHGRLKVVLGFTLKVTKSAELPRRHTESLTKKAMYIQQKMRHVLWTTIIKYRTNQGREAGWQTLLERLTRIKASEYVGYIYMKSNH